MRLSQLLCVALLIGLAAMVAVADPADPTVIINQHNDPTCGTGVVCVADLGNFSLTIPAGQQTFSEILQYTGTNSVTSLDLLFVNPINPISCQSDIFAICSSLPEIFGGQPALLVIFSGSGPCQFNGVNNPPATCPGVINPGDALDFDVVGAFSQAQTVSFVPEPGTLLLVLAGLGPAIAFGSKRWGLRRSA